LSVTRLGFIYIYIYIYISFLLGEKKSPKLLEYFYPPTHHTLMQAASDAICFMKMPEHVVTRQTKIFKIVMLAQKFP